MTHSPKGGCYVSDITDEKFYAGGQFLPDQLPSNVKKAKSLAKKAKTKAEKLGYTPFRVIFELSTLHNRPYILRIDFTKGDIVFRGKVTILTSDKTDSFTTAFDVAVELNIDLISID